MGASKYREIAERLVQEIQLLPPGTELETEHEIAERFGVGRAAARSALQELRHRMLVRRVQGVGTFTSRRVDYLISPHQPPSWSRTILEAGSQPRTVVRSCEQLVLPDAIADLLERPRGSLGHLLHRRSFTDDLPAAWGAEWVPLDVVGELAVAVQVVESLDTILRDMAGAEPARAWSRASMEAIDSDVAVELGCSPGDWGLARREPQRRCEDRAPAVLHPALDASRCGPGRDRKLRPGGWCQGRGRVACHATCERTHPDNLSITRTTRKMISTIAPANSKFRVLTASNSRNPTPPAPTMPRIVDVRMFTSSR